MLHQIDADLRFDIRLTPTFHTDCHLIFHRQQDRTQLFIAVGQYIDPTTLTPQSSPGTGTTLAGFVGLPDTTMVPYWNQAPTFTTYPVTPSVANTFWERITYLRTLPLAPKRMGLDGISINGTITSATESYTFTFRSPDKKEQPDHGYIEAVFDVVDGLTLDTQTNNYLEQISGYFNLGLPIKDLGGNPHRIRIYGHPLSEDIESFAAYFRQLPTHQPLIIDMSNFERMGMILYPIFRQLLTKSPTTCWIASGIIQQHLIAIGVPATHIFAPEDAR